MPTSSEYITRDDLKKVDSYMKKVGIFGHSKSNSTKKYRNTMRKLNKKLGKITHDYIKEKTKEFLDSGGIIEHIEPVSDDVQKLFNETGIIDD